MPSFGFPGTLPVPPSLLVVTSEDEMHAVKVELTRRARLNSLAVFLSGTGLGLDTEQEGRLCLYSHNAGTNRPDALLAYTRIGAVRKNAPALGVRVHPLDVAAFPSGYVDLEPGTYWIAAILGPEPGSGTWQIHGTGAATGESLTAVPQSWGGSGIPPASFPAGGTAATSRLGMAGVFTPLQALGSTPAIVGQFKVGEAVVGDAGGTQFLEPSLVLRGGTFNVYSTQDLEHIIFGKPKLVLAGRELLTGIGSAISPAPPRLVLAGRAFVPRYPERVTFGLARMLLVARPVAFSSEAIFTFNAPLLILLGVPPRRTGEVILAPTVPESVTLVPSPAEAGVLTPSAAEVGLLTPTVVRQG